MVNFLLKILFSLDYVDEIFQTTACAKETNSLQAAIEELQGMTPAHMNTMLQKQPRKDAIAKFKERKSLTVSDVPPTAAPGKCLRATYV